MGATLPREMIMPGVDLNRWDLTPKTDAH